MPFVKLDTGILNSTLWVEKGQRDVFITALLLAQPVELEKPLEQIEVRSLELTGFSVPPGWYGFVHAAGVGIIRHALVPLEQGLEALEQLGRPDPESRSSDFEGRRLVRVDGGFVILNYMKYRDRDYGAAERMRRLRARKRDQALPSVTRNAETVPPNVTQADSREQKADSRSNKSKATARPSLEDVKAYCLERKNHVNPEYWFDFYSSKGWVIGKSPMKDWKAAVRTWERNDQTPKQEVCHKCGGPLWIPSKLQPGKMKECECQ